MLQKARHRKKQKHLERRWSRFELQQSKYQDQNISNNEQNTPIKLEQIATQELNAININIQIPQYRHYLYSLKNDPKSIQIELALLIKQKQYDNFSFEVYYLNKQLLDFEDTLRQDKTFLKTFKDGLHSLHLPYLQLKDVYDQVLWENNTQNIFLILDHLYHPAPLISPQTDIVTQYETIEWFENIFRQPFSVIHKYHKPNFFRHLMDFSRSITEKIHNQSPLSIIKKLNFLDPFWKVNYQTAISRFRNEILPFINDQILSDQISFIFNNESPWAVDLVLYSYLEALGYLEGADFILSFPRLKKFHQKTTAYFEQLNADKKQRKSYNKRTVIFPQ